MRMKPSRPSTGLSTEGSRLSTGARATDKTASKRRYGERTPAQRVVERYVLLPHQTSTSSRGRVFDTIKPLWRLGKDREFWFKRRRGAFDTKSSARRGQGEAHVGPVNQCAAEGYTRDGVFWLSSEAASETEKAHRDVAVEAVNTTS